MQSSFFVLQLNPSNRERLNSIIWQCSSEYGKEKSMKTAIVFCLVILLSACASSSIILTGQKHPPTDPSKVTLYTSAPTQAYDVIGLVSAQSHAGLSSDQQQINYAIQALKKEAAAVGANGIILSSTGDIIGGASGGAFVPTGGGGGVYSGGSSHNKEVNGTAIYVHPSA